MPKTRRIHLSPDLISLYVGNGQIGLNISTIGGGLEWMRDLDLNTARELYSKLGAAIAEAAGDE